VADDAAIELPEGHERGSARLERIAAELKSGDKPEAVTVRDLLGWFGAQRRGYIICFMIDEALMSAGLITDPFYQHAYIDAEIEFHLKESTLSKKEGKAEKGEVILFVPPESISLGTDPPPSFTIDPTYRIGKLPSANIVLTTVSPNHSIRETITIMLANDFSQLPVMTTERDVKGVISWGSIGRHLALGAQCAEARECMEAPRVIDADTSLFRIINEIIGNEYVLVRDKTDRISGIVTTSDLSLQFQQLTEPFLLLGEIENHIRRLIHTGKFSEDQLRNCSDPTDEGRKVDDIFKLNFGEYIRLLENKDCWAQLNLTIDRTIFISNLDGVRRIRNDVMHFNPDPISENDLATLRRFIVFLQKIEPIIRANSTV
jgi:CBS domain-containing protein